MRRAIFSAANAVCLLLGLLTLATPQAGAQTASSAAAEHQRPAQQRTASLRARLAGHAPAALSAGTPARVTGGAPEVTVPTCNASDLIAAINTVNASGGTVNLRRGCTYTLTSPDNDSNALPVIVNTVTINGNGDTIERAATAPKFRIFEVAAPGDFTLNNLTVSNGYIGPLGGSVGGGIRVASGRLTTNHTRITGSIADIAGGAVYLDNSSVGRFKSTTIDGNISAGWGAGLYLESNATATLTGCAVTDNRATAVHGGGLYLEPGATATLTRCSVTGNTSTLANGGGIANEGGNVIANHTRIMNNTAVQGGGIFNTGGTGVTLNYSPVTGNTASSSGAVGGGIYSGGPLKLNSSPVENNTATGTNARGGGIFNGGTATLRRSRVDGNHALGTGAQGGGIFNGGTVTLIASPVVANIPDQCAPPGSVPGCRQRG
ncbi:right-handed parallel beta-helix repeat-containing protein [Streptomyces sp. NPDC101194]|uniref:right-handed parallel beta-helix repeat-containing protein n=1 Tax=Streptomyces sp. NPDC101194 TaxID=3366127 RepID=UPI00381585B9